MPSDESTVLDTGRLVITDRCVSFAGQKRTAQWPLRKLLPVDPEPAECTVFLPVEGRDATSGFRYPPDLEWVVTSRLSLALAWHHNDWQAIERWRRLRDDLETRPPRPPEPPPGADEDPDAIARARAVPPPRPAARPKRSRPPLGRRVAARGIDLFVACFLFSNMQAFLGISDAATLWTGLVLFGLYECRAVARRGGSLGKRRVGLQVVDHRSGTLPSWGQALVRTCLLLTAVVTLFELLRVASGDVDQAWHDRIAGTDVVVAH